MTESWDWVPRLCFNCHGTGLAPSSDGQTVCGYCEGGWLTEEMRKDLDTKWRPVFEYGQEKNLIEAIRFHIEHAEEQEGK